MLLLAAAFAAQSANLPFGEWSRASKEPILSPQGSTWESGGTFNPAVVLHTGKIVMLYRAQDAAGTSRLGYAESKDGIPFHPPLPTCSLARN
jgi:beta-1,2-mannosidase